MFVGLCLPKHGVKLSRLRCWDICVVSPWDVIKKTKSENITWLSWVFNHFLDGR